MQQTIVDAPILVNSVIPSIILVLIAPLIVGIMAWYLNERSKRIYEEYKRKEARYSKLIECLRGFYIDEYYGGNKNESVELREEFLKQVNLSLMYCPDEVIDKANSFLDAVYDKRPSDANKEEMAKKALREFMVAMRKDLIKRKTLKKTKVKPEDVKLLTASKYQQPRLTENKKEYKYIE